MNPQISCMVTRSRDAAPEAAAQELRSRFHDRPLLLVEDDPLTREVMLHLLRQAGLAVDVAADGGEALEMAARTDYDVILMDMHLPGVDGLEATRRIRALPSHRNTPIMALTANSFDEDRQRCMTAGMNDFVAKPVRPQDLYSSLLRWLSRASCS